MQRAIFIFYFLYKIIIKKGVNKQNGLDNIMMITSQIMHFEENPIFF